MEYVLYPNGSFDIKGKAMQILRAYPAMEGRSLRPVSIAVEKDRIRYTLEAGSVELSFSREENALAITAKLEGLEGIRDFEWIGGAPMSGAKKVFAQGFGMEGPSGYYDATTKWIGQIYPIPLVFIFFFILSSFWM